MWEQLGQLGSWYLPVSRVCAGRGKSLGQGMELGQAVHWLYAWAVSTATLRMNADPRHCTQLFALAVSLFGRGLQPRTPWAVWLVPPLGAPCSTGAVALIVA